VAALYTKPSENAPVRSVPRPTIPLLFAILLTAAATLILGIVPGRILANARAAAATYPAVANTPPAAVQETARR
jgi:NADH-quinone oxidoreductase subunit N